MRPVVATLGAHTLGAAPSWQNLDARSVGCDSAWVLIHAWSDPGALGPGVIPARAPFQLQIRPSGGEERWMPLVLTVPAAARVCVRASLVELAAANLSTSENRIVVSFNKLDGPVETHNFYEEWLFPTDEGAYVHGRPPAWALDARVEIAPSDRDTALIRLVQNEDPASVNLVNADQLTGPIPVAGLTDIRVGPLNHSVRVVYRLAM